jgi:hypothetical protein
MQSRGPSPEPKQKEPSEHGLSASKTVSLISLLSKIPEIRFSVIAAQKQSHTVTSDMFDDGPFLDLILGTINSTKGCSVGEKQ